MAHETAHSQIRDTERRFIFAFFGRFGDAVRAANDEPPKRHGRTVHAITGVVVVMVYAHHARCSPSKSVYGRI